MKVVIEVDGTTCTVESNDYALLSDLLMLVEQAIKGTGYFPPEDSTLDYVENPK